MGQTNDNLTTASNPVCHQCKQQIKHQTTTAVNKIKNKEEKKLAERIIIDKKKRIKVNGRNPHIH